MGSLMAAVVVMALVVTKSVDLFRNLIDPQDVRPKWWWNVLALVIGFVYALGWGLDVSEAILQLIPALADDPDRFTGISGQLLTGFIIGMGAGFWHEVLDALSGVAKRGIANVPYATTRTTETLPTTTRSGKTTTPPSQG